MTLEKLQDLLRQCNMRLLENGCPFGGLARADELNGSGLDWDYWLNIRKGVYKKFGDMSDADAGYVPYFSNRRNYV